MSEDLGGLHLQMSVRPQLDAVVDLSRGERPVSRLFLAISQCRRGGLVAQQLPRRGADRDRIVGFVGRAAAVSQSGVKPPTTMDRRPEEVRDVHALAASVHDLRIRKGWITATVAISPARTIAEPLADEALDSAEDWGGVLFSEKPVEWQRPVAKTSSKPSSKPSIKQGERLAGLATAPPLSARLYREPVCRPRMVATLHDVVLNQTFRHPTKQRPRTPALNRWHDWYAVRPEGGPEAALDGTFFHADSFLRGHFGHAVTEQLSHLWAWDRSVARLPDLRLLISEFPDHPVRPWELELLEAAGISADRVTVIREPTRVERLVTSTPAYEIGQYIHPVMEILYDRVGASLEEAAAQLIGRLETLPERVFFTRHHDLRPCENRDEVEEAASRYGFSVVAPEEHPLAVQVAMARRATVVAGFGGSGMFHPIFAAGGKRMIVVTSTNYPAANERQICALRGNDLDIIRGTPRVEKRADGIFDTRAFHSPFSIDWEREGKALIRAFER